MFGIPATKTTDRASTVFGLPVVVVLVGLVVAGCGSQVSGGTPPGSVAVTTPRPSSPTPVAPVAKAAPLTDERRVEEQAFDLWLAQLIQPRTVDSFNAEPFCKGSTSPLVPEIAWCAQWAFQISGRGIVSGKPLSGAVMAAGTPPAEQRYVTASWSCSATDDRTPNGFLPPSRLGTDSSAGTIERRQIAISVVPQTVSDADRANGITWQGHVTLTFIQRFSYSAEDFANVGNVIDRFRPQPGYDAGQGFALLTVGQWTSYFDGRSDATVALQNGKLAASGPVGLGFVDSSNGQLSFNQPDSDCTLGSGA